MELAEVALQQALKSLAVAGLNLILLTKIQVEYHFYFPKTPISHQFPFRNWIFGKRDIIRDFVSLETSQRNMNHTIQSMKATMKVKPRRPAGLYLTTPIQFSKQVISHTLCNVLVVPKSGFLFRVS